MFTKVNKTSKKRQFSEKKILYHGIERLTYEESIMAFVKNGSYEALASATSGNTSNISTNTNPFGLKDFSRMLDQKFGNSAFSDNLLAAPPGLKESTNPFDTGNNWQKPKLDNYYNKPNPYSIKPKNAQKAGGAEGINDNKQADNGHSEAYNSSPASVFGGFNKGTGMAKGSSGRHKLDFCY